MTKRIRYLTIMLMLLFGGSTSLWAQDEFNPENPAEPGRIPYKLTLTASPAEGGSVYGGGNYVEGTTVNIVASNVANYRFINWTDEQGNILSTEKNFAFLKGEREEHLTANFVYDPDSPSEPTEIAQNVYYWLTIAAEEGGNVSGMGRYQPGTTVNVYAYAQENYIFKGWFNADGQLLTNENTYTLTTEAQARTLLAKFDFDPTSPKEPIELITIHSIKLKTDEGGTVNSDAYRLAEGKSTVIRAYANTGYNFVGWYKNGEFYTALPEFSYTMENVDVVFEARFEFNPSDPTEPVMPDTKKYAFYMMNIIGKPGSTVTFPVYLTNLVDCKDMTFQLTFNKLLLPDFESIAISAKASGYTFSYSNGIVEDGQDDLAAFIFSFVGGQTTSGNTALMSFTVNIPENITTAISYPVTINQVSVTNLDNTTQTASTRNGRLSVYKNGDANGDDVVSIIDAVLVVDDILGNPSDEFIEEVANVNDDEGISIIDAVGVVDIILDDSTGGNAPSGQNNTTSQATPD